jgi:Fe-S-cluster containining protein
VTFTDEDILRISEHLQMSVAAFCERYLSYDEEEGSFYVHVKPGGACVFLGESGCVVHEVKPVQCRTYPFWPELLRRRSDWAFEGELCEGIGRGPRHDAARIKRILDGEATDDGSSS